MVKLYFTIVVLFIFICVKAQKEPIETDILYSYYEQDGDHSAVLGGEGSQELDNHAPTIILKIPVSKNGQLKINSGIDTYTSASSGNIDKYTTGASNSEEVAVSAKDTRKHINIGYTENFANKKGAVSIAAGYSSEYDVESLNAGLDLNFKNNNDNHSFTLSVQAYLDEWLLIYPGEIRNGGYYDDDDYDDDDYDDDDYDDDKSYNYNDKRDNKKETNYNTDNRYTYNLGFTYEGIINKKTNFAVLLDYTHQNGLLITPFHRVYFDDGIESIRRKIVRIEHLPDARNKFALGFRLNRYLSPIVTSRFYYRYFQDDFGIKSHTASIELPLRVTRSTSIAPSLRFYQQTESDYFAPFAEHALNATYYTSDYDLSEFYSLNTALTFKYAPLGGVFNIKIGGKSQVELRKIQMRYSYYQRLDGLTANNIAIGTKFKIH